MRFARYRGHSVAVVGKYIWLVGGWNYDIKAVKKCERFDLLKGVWKQFDGGDLEFVFGVNAFAVKNRFVIVLEGKNEV